MFLPQRLSTVQDSRLALTASNFPQKTIRLPIDRSWPIEEIVVTVQVTLSAAAIASTAFIFYALANILRRVQLETTDDKGPRTVVNVTGPGLLGLVSNEGFSLDRCTLATIQAWQQGFYAGTGRYRISYRIPFVHPMVTGSLRPRMMLPVHLHPQDPSLVLEFAGAAEMFSGVADPFTAAGVEVMLIRREIPKPFAAVIGRETNGNPLNWFIRHDIQETVYPLAASLTNSEQRFAIPQPGQYSSLYIHHLKGGALGTVEDVSGSSTFDAETLWRIESGGNAFRQFRMRQLQMVNDWSRPVGPAGNVNLNIFTAASPKLVTSGTTINNATALMVPGPNFGGPLEVGQAIQGPSCVFHDFLSDGINDADELGSLLDCNLPALSGLKMEIVGNVTTPAGAAQSSAIQLVGRRFYDDLRPWQSVARLAAA